MTDERPTTEMVHAAPADMQHSTATVLDVIARAAADPTVNVDKLERLLAIQQTILADQRETSFKAALARLQASLPQIAKSGTITDRSGETRNRFARLEDIDVAIRPLCAAEGFSFSFDSKALPAGISEYTCTLSHRDGHSVTKSLSLPIDTGAGRNAVQSAGSTISYARRYLLSMHLHLVTRDEDNDGAGTPAPITAEHLAELRGILDAEGWSGGGGEARFLTWLKVGALEELPDVQYRPALMFLEEKRKAKAR